MAADISRTTSIPSDQASSGSREADWIGQLSQRTTPQFGQLATWLLLITCFIFAVIPWEVHEGPRQAPASLLCWLPANWLGCSELFWFFRTMLAVGALGWLLCIAVPWTCWITVIGFLGPWSMHAENVWHTSHIFHLAGNLLIIQAIWYTLLGKEIVAAKREKRFWTTPLYPRWVSLSQIAAIGLFHTAAGLSKICQRHGVGQRDFAATLGTHGWASWLDRPVAHFGGYTHDRLFANCDAGGRDGRDFGPVSSSANVDWAGDDWLLRGCAVDFQLRLSVQPAFAVFYLLPIERIQKRYAPLAGPAKMSA
ncbi:MAG: hypothetical protein U0894_13190 [Pirellulales bacterium]